MLSAAKEIGGIEIIQKDWSTHNSCCYKVFRNYCMLPEHHTLREYVHASLIHLHVSVHVNGFLFYACGQRLKATVIFLLILNLFIHQESYRSVFNSVYADVTYPRTLAQSS